MKKIVKTAKQQFEERLKELRVIERWEMCKTEIYYGCEDTDGEFILLREQDGEFKELRYGIKYINLVLREDFLFKTTQRFIDGGVEITPLFKWYASADHECEPFNLLDVYMSGLEISHITFEDEYQDVPESRIITAREQWERASAKAQATQVNESGYTYRVVNSPDRLVFYISTPEGCLLRKQFRPLDELRNDVKFVVNYIDRVKQLHPQDLDLALHWLACGEYKMSEVSLMDIYDVTGCYSCVEYEDIQVEQSVYNNLCDEHQSLRTKIINHLEGLCEQGLNIEVSDLRNYFALTLTNGDYFSFDTLEDAYLMKNDEGKWKVCCSFQGRLETESCILSNVSTNSLYHIISSLR